MTAIDVWMYSHLVDVLLLPHSLCRCHKYDGKCFILRNLQVGGLVAMCAAYYFLSQGWAMSSYSPFYIHLLRTSVEVVDILK